MKMGAFKVSQRQDEVIIKDPNLMTPFRKNGNTKEHSRRQRGGRVGGVAAANAVWLFL